MDPLALKLAAAYGLDLALGDPQWLPHPVRGLGWAIARGEALVRSWIRNEVWAGRFLVAAVTLGTWALVKGLLGWSAGFSQGALFVTEVTLLFSCLSTRDLAVESWPVVEALKVRNLPKARLWLSRIVGRDTDSLSEPEVVRATVETIGESALDGIVAPLFYAVLGGVPLACLYKAVNTLDSMVGYRSARYIRFGQAAARVDHWMNVVPARITAWLIAGAAPFLSLSGGRSLQVTYRDSWNRGQNSWIPEAAMAGALEVRLGGVNFYQGQPVEAPHLGDPRRPLQPEVIPQAIRLMYATSVLGAVLAIGIRCGLEQWL